MGLGAPRTKQRFGLDPRNTNWSNDVSRFGHRHLEKYGWKPGQGLGLTNNATTSHIKVVIKQDNTGLGASLARKSAKKDEFDSRGERADGRVAAEPDHQRAVGDQLCARGRAEEHVGCEGGEIEGRKEGEEGEEGEDGEEAQGEKAQRQREIAEAQERGRGGYARVDACAARPQRDAAGDERPHGAPTEVDPAEAACCGGQQGVAGDLHGEIESHSIERS
ncbi:hypothetical protein KL919_001792 [Ogataea angusta]|nr:hypothetical protein KL919_001792 [Ogataea angusta]